MNFYLAREAANMLQSAMHRVPDTCTVIRKMAQDSLYGLTNAGLSSYYSGAMFVGATAYLKGENTMPFSISFSASRIHQESSCVSVIIRALSSARSTIQRICMMPAEVKTS